MKKTLIKLFSGLLALEVRFISWQMGIFGRYCPSNGIPLTVDQYIDRIETDLIEKPGYMPPEVRMAISKLIVARRRGI